MTTADQIILTLKQEGPKSTSALANSLGVSRQAARQQLERLAAAGLIAFDTLRGAVGRPGRLWGLTDQSQSRFPDGHAQAIVELIDATRSEFGEAGLNRLITRRETAALVIYRNHLAGVGRLEDRVARLAQIRTAEGYMAEWSREADGSFLLVENHCPICAAARSCQGFCRSELAIFEDVIGSDATVERVEHLLAGARRCAYRITARD